MQKTEQPGMRILKMKFKNSNILKPTNWEDNKLLQEAVLIKLSWENNKMNSQIFKPKTWDQLKPKELYTEKLWLLTKLPNYNLKLK